MIHLRKVAGRGLFTYIRLDIIHKGKRKVISTDLWIYKSPKDKNERKHNKDTLLLAEQLKAEEQKKLFMYGFAYLDENRKKMNLFDFAERMLEGKKGSNREVFICALKALMKFHQSDDLKFLDVSVEFLCNYSAYLLANKSQNTAYSYFSKLNQILKQALKEQYIFTNPMDTVDKIPQATTKKDYLTIEEIEKLKNTPMKDTELKRAFLFSCFTGLRVSDCFAITWGQVSTNHILSFYPKKTPDKLKEIKLHPTAIEMMGTRKKNTERIFPLSYSKIGKKIQVWVKLAGIDKKITFHSSRHTCGSLGVKYSKDIYAVKEVLGHSNVKTTEIYAHLSKQQINTVIDSIPTI